MSDTRWFRLAHDQNNTLHCFGVWFGWYFIGFSVGKGWATPKQESEGMR